MNETTLAKHNILKKKIALQYSKNKLDPERLWLV